MPTDADWLELETKCTAMWTIQNGVNGIMATGPNGNSIFLPAAGVWDHTRLSHAGSYGSYWSSSLYTDSPCYAWGFYFNLSHFGCDYVNRSLGFSVRPVTE